MKIRGLLIAALVLAALAGTLYWSNHKKPAADTVKAADTTPKVLSLKESDVSQIEIKKKGQPDLTLQKADGNWKIAAPEPLGADQSAVGSMITSLSSLDADRVIEEKAGDISGFGLKDPAFEVDVTAAGNKVYKLIVGDTAPTGNSAYAMVEGDPRVFTIANYNKTSLDKSAGDLRDKRLLTADFDKASEIELRTPKDDIAFGRNKDAWQIVKPKPMRADSFQVDELVRSLKDAKMQTASAETDDNKDASEFAAGKLVATVKVTALNGTQTLEVRKNKNDYLAKSSALPGVYKVENKVGTSVDKKLDDFLNKKVFDFGYADPDKMEVHDGAKSYFFTRAGTDWWGADGKKLDLDSVDALLERIRDLSASKYPASGFNNPQIQLVVTSNDKKRTEKVQIAKSGDGYIAKREDEPELYEISATDVDNLQKAAAAVKVAPPPAPAAPAKKK